jgi:predicted GIY-YIG superfamily endonuclease
MDIPNIRRFLQNVWAISMTISVYILKCLDRLLQYIGPTGRSFQTKYKEHIRAIKHNKDTST